MRFALGSTRGARASPSREENGARCLAALAQRARFVESAAIVSAATACVAARGQRITACRDAGRRGIALRFSSTARKRAADGVARGRRVPPRDPRASPCDSTLRRSSALVVHSTSAIVSRHETILAAKPQRRERAAVLYSSR